MSRTANRKPVVSLAWVVSWLCTTGTVAVAFDFFPQPPKAQNALEVRGRHVLQIAGGCGCHGTNFAGWRQGRSDTFPRAAPFGERFVTSSGRVPASNITSDPDTGIGDWSDADLEKVLTEGINPGGEQISPLMPYRAYHGMAKSDMRALIAYLHRLRAVSNTVPPKSADVPTIGEVALPPAPEDRPTESVALGRYLVDHVCGCTDCHSSSESEAGYLTGKKLRAGGETTIAPNLTPDRATGLARWSRGDIARYLRTGTRPDGGLAQSSMAGLILTSFSKLTPDEANAIAAYLKSLPLVAHHPQ